MKIGIVTQAYYPYPGGVSEHVHHTAEELRGRGHDVRVITTRFGGDEPDPLVFRIGRAVSVPANGSICPVAMDPMMGERIRSLLDDQRFDVLHIHEPFLPTLCLSVLRNANAPVVGTFHASNERALGYRVFRDRLDRHAARLTHRIAVSGAARRTVERYFPGEYRVIPNGVDVARFADAESLSRLDDGSFNILFVGRMEPRKGAKFLFRALPEIVDAVPNARLIVVGGGPFSMYYCSFLPRGRCREITSFEGFVSAEMLARHYASADVFCSPATGGESFGIVLLEAMAAGAAIVASDIHGYRDVVEHGRTGLLVRPASPSAVAEGIIRLACDEELREAVVANARAAVRRYAWSRVTAEIEDVYREAAGDSPARQERVPIRREEEKPELLVR